MDYRVDLEVFRGPLDLLLYLVRKFEIDVFDIPIAKITEQYLEYLNVIDMIEVDVAGDFLVMAATLMEIKSRMLLPRQQELAEGEEDPRMELARQLLEYKRFRDAAEQLHELADEQSCRFARVPTDRAAEFVDPSREPIRDVELWDLVSAFGRLMRQTLALAPKSIVYDETPIHVHMEMILRRLEESGQVAFTELFTGRPDRGRIIGIFLAILELAKTKQIRAEQNEPLGEIWILPRPPEEALELAGPDGKDASKSPL